MVTYDIQARLDPATHEVSGYEEVVFANPTDRPLPEIVFQLYPNNFRPGSLYLRQVERQLNVDAFFPKGRDPGWLRVDEAAVDGVPAAFTESEAAGTVALAQPLPPGATASIRLRFATRVPEAFDRFGRFEDSYSLAYWYPRLGVPTPTGWDAPARRTVFQEFHDLRSNFRVRLDVPIGYTVGATGKRVDVAHLPGERKAYTFEARNVNSFAAIADPGLDETVHDAHGVRIHVLTRPDEQRLIQPLVEQSADLLKFFGDLVGPYPYEDLTIVSSLTVPGFGVELPQVVLLDRGNATLNNYLGWLGEFGLLGLNAHEIGHQWFFGILGSDEAASPWLDEGFTSYITQRWLESPRSGAEGRQFYFKGPFDLFNGLHLVPTDREDAYRYSVVEDGQDLAVPLTTGTDGIAAGQFGMWYKRGTAVINMLRLVMGDEPFDRFLQAMYARRKFAELTVADVQAIAEESAGRPLGGFFRTWVHGKGAFLDYRLADWVVQVAPDGSRRVVATIDQIGNTDLPVPVAVRLERGLELRGRYVPGKREVTVDLPAESTRKVESVVVDPDLATLDQDFANNGRFPFAFFPGYGGPYPDRHAVAIGLRPTVAAPGALLTANLATIRGVAVDGGIGITSAGPEWDLSARTPIWGARNYESTVSGALRQGPDGLAIRGSSLLAFQPRVGENPTYGVELGFERKAFQLSTAPDATPSFPAPGQASAITASVQFDGRQAWEGFGLVSGFRPPGPRASLGVEAGVPVLGTSAWYYMPYGAVETAIPLGWMTTLGTRASIATTVAGARATGDALKLERQGGFRTAGLASGNHLAALALDLAFPLGGTIWGYPWPFPVIWGGSAFVNTGWAADVLPGSGADKPIVAEAGLGIRTGLFGDGSFMLGFDWTPYNTWRGFEPATVTFGFGFGF